MHATISQDSTAGIEPSDNPVVDENYDYLSKRSYLTEPNNLIESIIHMLMCGLGGGLVALHVAYMKCGLFTAMAMNVVLSATVGYCVCMLVWSAQKLYGRVHMPKLTYPDVMEMAVLHSSWPWFQKQAKKFRYLVEVTLLCHLYGSCCVFIIMIARNLMELVSGDSTISDGGESPFKGVILSLIIPCAIICMVTDLKKLAPFALICDLFAVGLVLVLLWYSLHDIKVSPMDRHAYKSVTGLVEFTCVCIFVLEPVCYALPIENNMEQPEKFHLVVLAALPIYTVAMLTVGFFGYWYYGENAIAPITVHFPSSTFAMLLKILLCIVLYVVYALCFYLAFDIEWYYLQRKYNILNLWFWERFCRVLHVVVLILIAYNMPNVTRLMGILGAVSTIPAVLIYPPLIELLVNWKYSSDRLHYWRKFKCTLMMLLGFILCCVGSYFSFVEMDREFSSNIPLSHDTSLVERQISWNLDATDFKYDNSTVYISRTSVYKNVSTARRNVIAESKNSSLFQIPLLRHIDVQQPGNTEFKKVIKK